MSMIQTGIELQDNFTSVIYGIISSVNMAVPVMDEMQQSMNTDINTSGMESERNAVDAVTASVNELNAAMQNQSQVTNKNPYTQVPIPDPVQSPIIPEQSRAPPAPVEIPVKWDTDGLDVFTGTGIERFQQEVQSTNTMLNTLNQTQSNIQQTASGMDILPDSAIQDITGMGQRLQGITERIQQIQNNPVNVGTDTANAELEQLRSQLNQAIRAQSELNIAMGNMDIGGANDAYMKLSQTVSSTERYIRDNTNEQGLFNKEVQEGVSESNQLADTVKGVAAAYLSVQSVKGVVNASDELTLTTARIDLMNDKLQSTPELVNMVYASAQNARGSFTDMADVVARFGNNAKDAFGSSAEVVAFANLIQKQMTIAGASTQEASNAMLQLSQALGSGVLRGDELNSIFEQAPNLIQSIADYLKVPIGQIRQMAQDGELSASTVKAAIFAASDDINAKFNSMPMTWGQIWQSMQNTALIAFQPVLQRINAIANSDGFQNFVNNAIEAMATLANVVLDLFNLIGSVGNFIADNWSMISPIVYGVIAALATYAAYLAIVKGIELASAAASAVMAVGKGIVAAATMIATGATWAQTTAQMGLNGAMYACPIVWIIILIIALIAIFYAAVAAINHFAGTSISATGLIAGAIATAGAFIWNCILGVINEIIGIGVELYNLIATFANFFANVFNDPVGAILNLFSGMFDFILGIVQAAAKLIDTVLGSNLSGAVEGFRNDLADSVADIVGDQTVVMDKLKASDYQFKGIDYGDAWNAGYSFGEGIDDKISKFNLSDILGKTNIPNVNDYMSGLNGVGGDVNAIAGNTGAIKDSMDITSEDVKYLRDLAEQDTINKYTVAEINIDQSGMQNTIKNGDDIDGFISTLTDAVNEAVDGMTEGVHK